MDLLRFLGGGEVEHSKLFTPPPPQALSMSNRYVNHNVVQCGEQTTNERGDEDPSLVFCLLFALHYIMVDFLQLAQQATLQLIWFV